jgi:hypothetical protein
VGKPEGKRPLERLQRREDNIKIDLRETGLDGIDLISGLSLDPEDGCSTFHQTCGKIMCAFIITPNASKLRRMTSTCRGRICA